MNTAPKYSKVELLIKHNESFDGVLTGTTKIDFLNCGMIISGDYLIIVIDGNDELSDALTSIGRIFNLKEVSGYKTYV